jgi:TetR/AcrR family transcriptional regulator, transcriptional repressor for nem operon
MKVSREQVEANRGRILEAASRLFRERGFEGVTVAEVMQAAGLTHGGFYGYFKSKDDLIAQALAALMGENKAASRDLADFAAAYLAPEHRDDRAGGCGVAALGAEVGRGTPEARAEMTSALRRQIEGFSHTAAGATPEERREAAIGSWSAMVGAVILSRMSDDPELADEILAETRAFIAARAEPS